MNGSRIPQQQISCLHMAHDWWGSSELWVIGGKSKMVYSWVDASQSVWIPVGNTCKAVMRPGHDHVASGRRRRG